jgi:hypothetical protein
MGFRANRVFVLQFEDEMAGAEVKIRSGSIQDMQALSESSDTDEAIDLFLKYAESWNFDRRDGTPCPLEKGEIKEEVDEPTFIKVCGAWWRASTRIPAPLEEKSTSGDSSPEESIPTEVL